MYQYPHYVHTPMYNYGGQSVCWACQHGNRFDSFRSYNGDGNILLTDYGPKPFIVNINEATKQNNTFRTAL